MCDTKKKVVRADWLRNSIIEDIILLNLSLLVSCLLRFDGNISRVLGIGRSNILILVIGVTAVKIAMFFVFKLYKSIWKFASIYEMLLVVGAVFSGNMLVALTVLIAKIHIPLSIFLITIFIDITFVGGFRFSHRILKRITRGIAYRIKGTKRVMIIGSGRAAAIIVKELIVHTELKSRPVAIIGDSCEETGKKINGVSIVGGRDEIQHYAGKKKVDEIIIAIPNASNKEINDIYARCSETGCKIKILPSMFQLIDESVTIQRTREVNAEDLLGREPVKLDISEISSYLNEQVVLVTGGGGSIGSELCRQIFSFNPSKLIILDNYENNAYDIENELIYKNPELNLVTVIANIREKGRIEKIFEQYKPDVVFHAAAHKHVPLMEKNPCEAVMNNVQGTLNIVECADLFKVKRFVLVSTDKAVNPTNVMGATKRIAEMIIQAYDKKSSTVFAAVRFGNVLGSNGSVIPLFVKQIENGGPVTVTHPEVTRFFMTIPEAVQLVIQAGAMSKGGEIFVLDMGEPVKIYDLARNLISLSGYAPDEDIEIEFTGLRPGEKLYEEVLLAEESLEDTKNNKIFITKPVFVDIEALRENIEALVGIAGNETDNICECLEKIVPTYSRFEG